MCPLLKVSSSLTIRQPQKSCEEDHGGTGKTHTKIANPRYLWYTILLDHANAKKPLLAEIDRLIGNATKAWLHLAPHICDSVFYSARRDGRLGLHRMESIIPIIRFKWLVQMYESKTLDDHHCLEALITDRVMSRAWSAANVAASNLKVGALEDVWKVNLTIVSTARWRQKEIDRWASLTTQGSSTTVFQNDSISNEWLSMELGFTESETIIALKLRWTNTLETRASVDRRREEYQDCKICGSPTETTLHFVSLCEVTKYIRISNHNEGCRRVAGITEVKGWMVERERRITTRRGACLAPDLIMRKNDTTMTPDVAICWLRTYGPRENCQSEEIEVPYTTSDY